MPGLREEIHSHCFNGTERGSFDSVGRGPAKAWWERERKGRKNSINVLVYCASLLLFWERISSPSLSSMIGLCTTPNISITARILGNTVPSLLCSSCQPFLMKGEPQWIRLKNKIPTRALPPQEVCFSSCHIYLVNARNTHSTKLFIAALGLQDT